jgi:cytochrome c oxidase assembly protein subunit 15
MGWYMVKSGLVDEPAVSHYRLAAHLLLAFVIYGCLLRLGLVLLYPSVGAEQPVTKLRGLVRGTIVFAAVVMLWGAFVAGLDAGLLYNSFPTMNGYWFPPETAQYVPVWKAFFEEPATVQWTHRILAMLFFAKVVFLFRRGQSFGPSPVIRKLLWAVLLATVLQMILGILTLLSQVNIVLATMHQAGALLLLTSLIALLHFIPRKDKT